MKPSNSQASVTLTLNDAWREALRCHESNRLAEAERIYLALLKKRPDHRGVLTRLGALLMQQERHAQALAVASRGSKAFPTDVSFSNQRALALSRLERFNEAHEAYLQALPLAPEDPELLANIGANLVKAGRFGEAIAWLQRGLTKAPALPGLRLNMANALIGQGREDAARAVLEQLLVQGHRSVEAFRTYATVLRHAGDAEASLKALREGLAMAPNDAGMLVQMGSVMLDQGKFEESEALFRQALDMDPNRHAAWAGLVRVRRMTPADAPWLAKAEKLLRSTNRLSHQVDLRYAMGKFCDDTGDYEQAFEHYRAANEIQKKLFPSFDLPEFEGKVAQLTRAYTRELVRAPRVGSNDSTLPVLIAGMPRSGTSLVEQIVASHPQAFGAGELLFWSARVRKNEAAYLSGSFPPELLSAIADQALRNLGKRGPQALRVTDKMPGNFKYLGMIHAVFPRARILHLRRHPIDTCLSIYFQNFQSNHAYAIDLEALAAYYRAYHRLMAHWRSVLPADVFMDVPYEALVEDQEHWTRKILDFIGLDWDPACLEFHQTQRRVATASNWQARQKMYKTSKERWRNYEKFIGPLLPLQELYEPLR